MVVDLVDTHSVSTAALSASVRAIATIEEVVDCAGAVPERSFLPATTHQPLVQVDHLGHYQLRLGTFLKAKGTAAGYRSFLQVLMVDFHVPVVEDDLQVASEVVEAKAIQPNKVDTERKAK